MDLTVQPKPPEKLAWPHQSRLPTYFKILTRWKIELQTLRSTPKTCACICLTNPWMCIQLKLISHKTIISFFFQKKDTWLALVGWPY